jgi:hypothetical protein
MEKEKLVAGPGWGADTKTDRLSVVMWLRLRKSSYEWGIQRQLEDETVAWQGCGRRRIPHCFKPLRSNSESCYEIHVSLRQSAPGSWGIYGVVLSGNSRWSHSKLRRLTWSCRQLRCANYDSNKSDYQSKPCLKLLNNVTIQSFSFNGLATEHSSTSTFRSKEEEE